MKATVRQQLRQFHLRIQRRIDRENANVEHDGQPVLRGTGALYEISDRVRAVAAGGVALIHRMVQAIGLDKEIDKCVHLLKFHLPYDESDHVTNIAYNFLAGGDCLEHLELLRNDENYLDMLGARRIPDPTTAGDFCRRFKTPTAIDALQRSINEARLRVWRTQPGDFFEHALIDADGSMVATSDCTDGADFSYKGTFGFQPLLITLANTQEVLFIENKPASRPSHEGAAARLDEAVRLVRRAGFRRVTLRGDTDFSQTRFLDGWDEQGVEFVFGYANYENVVELADSVPESDWVPLERGNRYKIKTAPRARPTNTRDRVVTEREYRNIHLVEERVSEFEYQPTECKKKYRMVVVRKLLTHEKGQKLLFADKRYFFYITNRRDISARAVVELANKRCAQERVIGQQKSDVKSLCCPLDNLQSNWAYMVCATLAWNLAKWFALLLPEKGRWKEKHADEKNAVLRMNFGTFVSAFMRIPAQVMRGARQVRLRLLSWNPWQRVFFRALDSVRAIS